MIETYNLPHSMCPKCESSRVDFAIETSEKSFKFISECCGCGFNKVIEIPLKFINPALICLLRTTHNDWFNDLHGNLITTFYKDVKEE